MGCSTCRTPHEMKICRVKGKKIGKPTYFKLDESLAHHTYTGKYCRECYYKWNFDKNDMRAIPYKFYNTFQKFCPQGSYLLEKWTFNSSWIDNLDFWKYHI